MKEIETNYSKSTCQRAICASILVRGKITIKNVSLCDDVKYAIELIKKIGCNCVFENNNLYIDSKNLKYNDEILNCGESATLLRLFIPIGIFLFKKIKLTGENRLLERPLIPYEFIFNIEKKKRNIECSGIYRLQKYIIDGTISSQFISGLLFVLPLLEYDTEIIINGNIGSKNYILLTIDVLKKFGINIEFNKNNIFIKGNQKFLKNIEYINEIDESTQAFYKILNYFGEDIKIGYNEKTKQPDKEIDNIIVNKPNIIDCDNFPDLVPLLIPLTYSFKYDIIILENVNRLEYKESNRIKAILDICKKLNIKIEYNNKDIKIYKSKINSDLILDTYNDHRIAMMLLIFKKLTKIDIKNIEVLTKSIPMYKQFV